MRAGVRKWGKSVTLWILRLFASGRRGRMMIIMPVRGEGPRLDDLLAGVAAGNVHGEIDCGDAVGREVW